MHTWPPPRCPPDRLSDLSDDVLTHILSFVPTKEAASTTALSRRWRRPLWLDTSVVNLDYRSHTTHNHEYNSFYFRQRDRRGIKKVAIVLGDKKEEIPWDALSSAVHTDVEVVHLECQHGGCPDYTYAVPSMSLNTTLSLDMLPLASLRVLDLTGCKLSTYSPMDDYLFQPSYTSWDDYMYQPPDMSWPLENYEPPVSFHDNSSDYKPPLYQDDYHYKPASHWGPTYEYPPLPQITFPFLEALRLRRCAINLKTLQTMINVAPRLTNLRLESISVLDDCGVLPWLQISLRCPSVVTMVMANLHNGTSIDGCHIKLEAPRLQRLWYTQSMCADTSFSFESPSPHLRRVHLGTHSVGSMLRCSMLAAMSHIRFLKLTTYSMIDIAHDDLPVFPNLERLELEELTCSSVLYHDITASAIANMLRKCPALRELRLKFSWREYLLQTVPDPVIRRAVMSDFEYCRSIRGEHTEDCRCEGLDLLPGLSCGCGLHYLRTSLRRVVLQFDVDELNCFQVRLLRFFSHFAMALEDIIVDGGLGYDSSYIDRKVARWRTNVLTSPLLKGDQRECYRCCVPLGLSSSTRPPFASNSPPLTTSEFDFPPLDASLTQTYPDGEVDDDNYDDYAEEDIFRRYFLHSVRKKKKGGSPGCLVVKPKSTTKRLIKTPFQTAGASNCIR